jgi:hypothetical protein
MQYIALNSLVLHNTSDPTVPYIVRSPLEGLEQPDMRFSSYDKPGEHGSKLANMLYGSRVITLHGYVKGADVTAYEANRQALITAIQALTNNSSTSIPVLTLTFTTLASTTYNLSCYARKINMPHERIDTADFTIELVATDPLIYLNTNFNTAAVPRSTGGGFTLPVIVPIVSDTQTGGSVVVYNQGSVPVAPTIILTAPLTNPYVINTTTQQYIQLNTTIAVGDVVTINMAEKTIVRTTISTGSQASLISTKVTGSTWWTINTGNNTINFSTGDTGDTGTMQITGSPAVIGV